MIEPQQTLIYQSQDGSASIDVILADERLKHLGKDRDYFDELTRHLQDIRTSERHDMIPGNKTGYPRRHSLRQKSGLARRRQAGVMASCLYLQ